MYGEGYLLQERIDGAHPKLKKYPLLEDDLLQLDSDGTYTKVCPGAAVVGFRLTSAQEERLKKVSFEVRGLDYTVIEERISKALGRD